MPPGKRKAKEGEITTDIFSTLATAPNAEVGRVHPKVMPLILTTEEEQRCPDARPWDEAGKLQRPFLTKTKRNSRLRRVIS
jgi:putative SOS response-associated peptidase YedK